MMRRWIVSVLLCVLLFPSLSAMAQEDDVDDVLSQLPPRERAIYRSQLLQLERVARRLLEAIPEQKRPRVQFSLVPGESSINAGAASGQIMVTEGMLRFVRSDDELAMILGHELAHITQGHVARGAVNNTLLGIGSIIANVLVPNSGQLAGTVGQLFLNHYNQSQEREADSIGLRYAFDAGFDPDAGSQVMERMAHEVPQTATGGFFSSHPGSIERAEMLRREAVALGGRQKGHHLAREDSARRSELQRDEEACQRAKTYFYRAKDMGEIDEKIVLYQRGLHICLQSPRAHFELANAYADRGETREALDELREVLRYDLNYPGARERLHALQEHSSLAGYENDASTNNASGRNGSSSTRKKQTK